MLTLRVQREAKRLAKEAMQKQQPINIAKVRSCFLVFVPTIREIRDFYREMQRTNRESITMCKTTSAAEADPELLPGIKHLIGRKGVELMDGVWDYQKKVDFCTGEAIVNCLLKNIKERTTEVCSMAPPATLSSSTAHDSCGCVSASVFSLSRKSCRAGDALRSPRLRDGRRTKMVTKWSKTSSEKMPLRSASG
eukprot:SAG31_NODE_5514_length_2485_cov_1.728835_5_plen_194_part_00